MPESIVPLHNLLAFAAHFAAAGACFAVFVWAYIRFTPWDDLDLIRKGDTAAAVSLAGAMIGFAIPVAIVVASSHEVLETAAWSAIALAVQMGVYCLVRMAMRNLAAQIVGGNAAEGVFLGAISVAVGILEAGCLWG